MSKLSAVKFWGLEVILEFLTGIEVLVLLTPMLVKGPLYTITQKKCQSAQGRALQSKTSQSHSKPYRSFWSYKNQVRKAEVQGKGKKGLRNAKQNVSLFHILLASFPPMITVEERQSSKVKESKGVWCREERRKKCLLNVRAHVGIQKRESKSSIILISQSGL